MTNSMTVAELIEALKRCGQHKPVLFNGEEVDCVEEQSRCSSGSNIVHSVVNVYCRVPHSLEFAVAEIEAASK